MSANQEATGLTLVGQPPTDTPLSTRLLLFQAPQSGKAGDQELRCEPGDVVDWTACISCSVFAAPLPSAITFHASLCAVSCPLIPSLCQLGLDASWGAILGSVWENWRSEFGAQHWESHWQSIALWDWPLP